MRVKSSSILLLLESFFLGIIFALIYDSLSIFLCEMIGGIIVFFLSKKMDDRSKQSIIIIKLIAVCAVLMVYYGNLHLFGAPYFRGGDDDLYFERVAHEFIDNNIKWPWNYQDMSSNITGFYWLLSRIMMISGVEKYHTLSFRFLNVAFLIATGELVYLLMRFKEKYDDRYARIIMLLVCLFPNSMYLSTYVFRDTMSLFLLMLGFTLANDFYSKEKKTIILCKNRIAIILLLAVLMFASFWIRKEVVAFIIVAFMLCALRERSIHLKETYKYIIVLALVFSLFYKVGAIQFILDKIGRYLKYRIDSSNTGGLSYYIFTQELIPFGFILRLLYGLISPLPVALLNITSAFSNEIYFFDVLVSLGTSAQIVALPFLFRNIRRIDKYMLMYVFILTSVVETTFTFRHFLLGYPFMIILIMRQVYEVDWKKRALYVAGGVVCFLIMALAYMVIK